ncbi:MAG: NTPase [candidate division WOR-3 bacterium]|nr:NTPase [candidate division WOR-3 bacterium]
MKILITGKPRSGKTTLIKKLLSLLPNISFGGFFTEEIKENGKRIGFKIVTTFGEQGVLAHQKYRSSLRISRYGVNLADLEIIGINSLKKALQEKDLIIIDEIGKMELMSDKFKSAIQEIFHKANRQAVIATIPISNIPFLNHLKSYPNTVVFDTSKQKIEDIIKSCLKSLTKWHDSQAK